MRKVYMKENLLAPILAFLQCETPEAWLQSALANQDIMLIDHCNCEKKAASTALSLIYRYTEKDALLMKMSKLAREELRHFEQVLKIMKDRGVRYATISPSRYAKGLIKHVRTYEPAALIDKLIIGAYIEARSCERFAKIAPLLDEKLRDFYLSLLKSESRHFSDYLKLAQLYSEEDIGERVTLFGEVEAELILSDDSEFRFHSGVPPLVGRVLPS
ncbi:MAG: tRNA-(ms[2]io[6]A)-hydroxylase [Pseudomonadales bacterium]|nr:tRNA-(ms[2]io[6]A)-hydroxylase [Pseudomonadales bacterium]